MNRKLLFGLIFLSVFTTFIISSFTKTYQQSPNIEYSGQEMFRCVFFNEGNLSNKVPEITYYNVANLGNFKVKSIHAKIITEIATADPLFFNHFKEIMQSGSPTKIEECLINSQKIVDAELNDSSSGSSTKINTTTLGAETEPTTQIVAYLASIAFATKNPSALGDVKGGSLQMETLAFAIANNFKK